MIKCCIFDLDGTLLDTITTITHFVNEAIQKYGIKPITKDECKYFAGNGARLLIRRTLESRGVLDAALQERILLEYNAAYDANPTHLTGVFDGIPSMLAALKARGIKLAVLSNKPSFAVRGVVGAMLPQLLDDVCGGEEGVPLKPDATAARAILSRFGASPSECAFVGDTSTDIETAKNLGAALSVGVLWGFRPRAELVTAGADVTVETAEQLLSEVLAVE